MSSYDCVAFLLFLAPEPPNPIVLFVIPGNCPFDCENPGSIDDVEILLTFKILFLSVFVDYSPII